MNRVQKGFKMLTKKNVFFSVVLFFMLTAAGCVSVQGLYVDPSFTYQSVLANNIGVAGVVSATRRIRPSRQTALSNLMQNALIKHFPGLPIMPAGDVVRALGVTQYKAMMEYYRLHGVVPGQYLSALYKHVIYMRYVAFVRVEQDSISHDRQQYEDNTTPRRASTSTIAFTTKLTVRVQIDVYDVITHRIVWRGSLNESTSRSNRYEVPSMVTGRREGLNRAIAQSVIGMAGTAIVDSNHSYPTAPSFYNFMQRIFNSMIGRFPKKISGR